MHACDYRQATLVLAGHGSTRNRASSIPIRHHAQTLRQRGIFADVVEAFWLEEPRLSTLWQRIATPTVIIVPVFISEGYFTRQAIPETLGLRQPGTSTFASRQVLHDRLVLYAPPVGTHSAMTDALCARARNILRNHPGTSPAQPATTTLLIGGHGTDRNDQSRTAIEDQVQAIKSRRVFADVQPAFLEEEPRFADWPRHVQTRDVVVTPFFISDGLHTLEDIPVLLGLSETTVRSRLRRGAAPWENPTALHGHRVWYTQAIGTDPFLTDIILERAAEAAA